MNTKHILKIIIGSALSLSSCNIKFILPSPTPELSAPPVEGESSAPLLESSADEILINLITPSGVCTVKKDTEILECFNIDGELISSIQVPGIGSADPQGLHLAGVANSGTALPVVYYSWIPEQSLMISENRTVIPLRKTRTFLAMSGVPEEPILAFSEMVIKDNIPHSYLYVGSLKKLETSDPFIEMSDTKMGMVLMPVAVEAGASQAGKVWFTHSAWEISGEDRIFPINSGLYVFDLKSGTNSEALSVDRNFQGLSPDRTQAGSISFDLKGDHSMRVTNLLTSQMVNFPLDPISDRGAGNVVFSIDSEFAAWVESSGSISNGPPEFKINIRIGNIETGAVVQELDSSTASKILGWEWVSYMRPMGWLDSKTLIIEIHEGNPKASVLVKYDVSDGSLQLLCEGVFSGFSYS